MRLRDVALMIFGGKPERRAIDAVPWDAGGSLRATSVSADQALGLVPVFAAVRLLASQVASLPLQAYRKTGDSRARIPAPSLFVSPSVHGTLYDWLHRCVTSLALRGNAYGLITQRDRDQYPTMIEWLHPDDVFVNDQAASGPGSYTNPIWYWQGRIVPTEDLVHIPWFTVPGRVQGLSPIGACAATISTGISAQNYTADWFDNGAVPPGEFRNTAKTVNQQEADIISARLNAAIRRRRPLVYGNDWEYKPISVSAHEAKFVETLKMNATQVAAIYGIPPEMIGGEAGGPLTYNTVEQNSLNFLKFTLRPWLELLEAAFYSLTPRPQYVKFNIDALLRSDLTTRMQAYQVARNIGLQNIDEQRALEDLPPLPDGKGQDYTALEILAKQASTPPTPALRYASVVEGQVEETAPLLGVAAALEIEGRRRDPHDPAAMEGDVRKFNPLQPRDPGGEGGGQWTKSPAGAAKAAVKDLLELAGRIELDRREKLISSDRLIGDNGGDMHFNWAVVHGPYENDVRIGIIPHEDSAKWRAADLGGTATLTADQVHQLRTDLANATAEAKKAAKEADAHFGGRLPANPGRDKVLLGIEPVAQGVMPNDWADLHWNVYLTDSESEPWLLSVYAGDPDTSTADPVQFAPKKAGSLLKALDGIEAQLADTVSRAYTPAGMKGAKQLHDYWTKGEGLAKWVDSPHPWTALYHHLLKYMAPGKAKRTASQWFHDVFGIWPGEREGENPVGPG